MKFEGFGKEKDGFDWKCREGYVVCWVLNVVIECYFSLICWNSILEYFLEIFFFNLGWYLGRFYYFEFLIVLLEWNVDVLFLSWFSDYFVLDGGWNEGFLIRWKLIFCVDWL